jgi:RNase P/RNase MRP subunit POP5
MVDGSAELGGIYDDFPGYRLPPDQEIDEALRAALVIIDANVLLNLYRYNESTRDDLLGVLREVGDRLWVPHQVMREFWRNRVGVLASRGSGTVQALDALSKQQRASMDAIRQWAKSVAAEAHFQERLIGKIEALHAELEDAIRARLSPA